MAPQLYLITPANADPETFPATLMAVLNAAEFSALLVRRGNLDSAAYAKHAAKLVNIGQGAGCAVLLEDDLALVKKIGAEFSLSAQKPPAARKEKSSDLRQVEEDLADLLTAAVEVRVKKRVKRHGRTEDTGEVAIQFASLDELNGLIDRLRRTAGR